MQVELNSILRACGADGLPDGLYRVLKHYPDNDSIILFEVDNGNKIVKPNSLSYDSFHFLRKNKNLIKSSIELPFYLICAETEIKKEHIRKRDKRYTLISGLVNQPGFLLEITLKERSKIFSEHSKKVGCSIHTLYRLLNLYWKYGQEKNALLPAYKLSGGSGKIRVAGENKRGAPLKFSTFSMQVPQGVNTKESDKEKFVLAMKMYGLKGEPISYSRIYKLMLLEFYADELIMADMEFRLPNYPSYRSFLYWVKKLFNEDEIVRRQTNKGDFERNKRGLRGSSTDHTENPGSCFELDATVLDVHIVSEFRRNYVLGRPTLYCVVDKESRMVVGLHVSLEYASWRAGRQALVNSFTSKVEYCSQFGIEIDKNEWPCAHIPQRLLCDRGEFICKQAEQLAVPLIGHLSIAAPYRADYKGTIEKRFDLLNHNLIHELAGSTKGKQFIRGDKDPRQDAIYTLPEVTKLLIDLILEFNSSYLSSLTGQSTLLIEAGLSPTPLNYWNLHVSKHRHSLSVIDEAVIRARLLPVTYVSMTSKGIRMNDEMYYESDRDEFEAWKIIARNTGSWKMEARIDQDNSSFIFVRLKESEGFTRCNLMKRSANFENRHIADISFFEDWRKLESIKAGPNKKSVERHERRKAVTNTAIEKSKSAPPLASKIEKVRDMKQRRREAISDSRHEDAEPLRADEGHLKNSTFLAGQESKADKVISMLSRRSRK